MTANTLPTPLILPAFTAPGPTEIWASTGASNAMAFLGVTRNGITINEQPFMVEAKSDASGGEQGPPADFQWLGEAHMIECELAQFNTTTLGLLARRVQAAVTARTKGILVGAAGGTFRVLFISAGFVRNYTKVFITDPISYSPVGTAIMFPRITFFGLEDANNTDSSPWNTTYTATSSPAGIS